MLTAPNGKLRPSPSKAYKAYEEAAGWLFREQHVAGKQISYPVRLSAMFWLDKNITQIDLVGLVQALQDAMVTYGVIADDNRGIIAELADIRAGVDKADPRTEVTLTPIGEVR
jgi:Holliday junction resolvase RusA-like endonuclease